MSSTFTPSDNQFSTHRVTNQVPPLNGYDPLACDPGLLDALNREAGGVTGRLRRTAAIVGSAQGREHARLAIDPGTTKEADERQWPHQISWHRTTLLIPGLRRKGRVVQLIASGSPVWKVPIHERGELLTVVALKQVRHLVDDDVLHAVGVFLGEFNVEPDVPGFAVAGPPLGLHPADGPTWQLASDDLFPTRDESRDVRAELFALPPLQDLTTRLRCSAGGHVEQQPLAVGLDVGPSRSFDDLESVSDAPDVMRLASDHLALRLAVGGT
jgi:hypothetical protein